MNKLNQGRWREKEQDIGNVILGILGMIFSIIGAVLLGIWSLIWKIITSIFSFLFSLASDILSGVRGRVVQAGSALVFFALIAYAIHFAIK